MTKNSGNHKKPDGRKISKKLNLRQRHFIAEYTNPESEAFGNATKAAEASGYSLRRAMQTGYDLVRNREIEREINRILDAAGVTIEKLAKTVNQGLKAKVTKPFLHQATGKVKYSRPMVAHDIRLKAARLGFELRGDMAPKEINFNVTLLASKLDAARRRERERQDQEAQEARVKEEDNNRPEEGQPSKEVKLLE